MLGFDSVRNKSCGVFYLSLSKYSYSRLVTAPSLIESRIIIDSSRKYYRS